MKIQCENESCKNDIYIEENITCPSCKQIQKKKLTIKPLFMGTTLALISAYSAYEISSKLHSSTKRYPVKTEFSIINHCINGDNTLQYIKDLTVKKNICIEAYNKTIQDVKLDDFKENHKIFTKLFRENINRVYFK